METPMWFLAITCCLSEDRHLIQDAVLLKCGGRACAKCALSLSKCSHCKVKHESHDDNILMRDSLVEIFIEKNYSSIIEHLDMQYKNKHQEFRSSVGFIANVDKMVDDNLEKIKHQADSLKDKIDQFVNQIGSKVKSFGQSMKANYEHRLSRSNEFTAAHINSETKDLRLLYEYQKEILAFDPKSLVDVRMMIHFEPNYRAYEILDEMLLGRLCETPLLSDLVPPSSYLSEKKPFVCDKCGDRYKTRPGLTYHIQKMHSDKNNPEISINNHHSFPIQQQHVQLANTNIINNPAIMSLSSHSHDSNSFISDRSVSQLNSSSASVNQSPEIPTNLKSIRPNDSQETRQEKITRCQTNGEMVYMSLVDRLESQEPENIQLDYEPDVSRQRTIFSDDQLLVLNNMFSKNKYPSNADLMALCCSLSLNVKVIRRWFVKKRHLLKTHANNKNEQKS